MPYEAIRLLIVKAPTASPCSKPRRREKARNKKDRRRPSHSLRRAQWGDCTRVMQAADHCTDRKR